MSSTSAPSRIVRLLPVRSFIHSVKKPMNKATATILSCAVAMAGCATGSKDISANYISPMQYQSYDCNQLASESQRIQVRVNQVGGRLDEAAANDKALTGVGIVLFWPVLFALGGTKQQEAEYARLKGEYDAVQQSAVLKKCSGANAVDATQAPGATEKVESSQKP